MALIFTGGLIVIACMVVFFIKKKMKTNNPNKTKFSFWVGVLMCVFGIICFILPIRTILNISPFIFRGFELCIVLVGAILIFISKRNIKEQSENIKVEDNEKEYIYSNSDYMFRKEFDKMALIKCEECGKEISDKAKICIHCGCPITSTTIEKEMNNNDYYEKEFEISKVEIDFENLKKYKKLVKILAIVFTLGIFSLPAGIGFWLYYYYFKGCEENEVILTNKRIKGKIKIMGAIYNIDIPLDKIDSINTEQNFMKINTICIRTASNIRGVLFAKNGEQFCSLVIPEIEKYKKYMMTR